MEVVEIRFAVYTQVPRPFGYGNMENSKEFTHIPTTLLLLYRIKKEH